MSFTAIAASRLRGPDIGKILNLSITGFTDDSVTLDWTIPSSTNPIQKYEVWVNGVFLEDTTDGSAGWTVTGLTPDSLNDFYIVPVDTMGNYGVASNEVSQITTSMMRLSYTSTTSLNLSLQTISGQDIQIDWGDGVWMRYSSSIVSRTKSFSMPTSGVARVRSAVGNPKSDINYFQSTDGTWSFDVVELSNVSYRVYFSGVSMALTGDISALSSVTYQVFLLGNSMALTGDISALSSVTNRVLLSGNSMALTGDISALSNVTYQVYFSGVSMALTGDISALSSVTYQVFLLGNSMALTYAPGAWSTIPINQVYVNIATGRLSTTEVDNLLSDLNETGSSGTSTIDLRYNNQAPSATGISAANALRLRGYTVLTN